MDRSTLVQLQRWGIDMSRTLLLLVLLVAARTDAKRVIHAVPESEKTGRYIVKLEDDTSHDRFEELKRDIIGESVDYSIYETVEGSVSKIFAAKLPDDALDRVRLSQSHIRACIYL